MVTVSSQIFTLSIVVFVQSSLSLILRKQGSSACGVKSAAPRFYPPAGFDIIPGEILNRKKRLVHGTEVTPHSWPWHVLLQLTGSFYTCGGVLLSEKWVLTAAHCFSATGDEAMINENYLKDLNNWTASVGIHNNSAEETTTQRKRLKRIILHHRFKKLNGYNDDIALVELQSNIEFNENARSICLPENPIDTAHPECFVAALKEETVNDLLVLTVLEQIKIPVYKEKDCQDLIGEHLSKSGTILCAGDPKGILDTEPGNSGNALMCNYDGKWVVAGLMSLGLRTNPTFTVYTNVSSYLDWIHKCQQEQFLDIECTSL